jgi:UDP-glucose 6-dehydrogenase
MNNLTTNPSEGVSNHNSETNTNNNEVLIQELHKKKVMTMNEIKLTYVEQLLLEEVRDNLGFLLKYKDMDSRDIKDFIFLCISMRIDISKHYSINIQNMVNNIFNHLDMEVL